MLIFSEENQIFKFIDNIKYLYLLNDDFVILTILILFYNIYICLFSITFSTFDVDCKICKLATTEGVLFITIFLDFVKSGKWSCQNLFVRSYFWCTIFDFLSENAGLDCKFTVRIVGAWELMTMLESDVVIVNLNWLRHWLNLTNENSSCEFTLRKGGFIVNWEGVWANSQEAKNGNSNTSHLSLKL